ncbi:diguanylate cyclase (GGDEF)-like protein [Bacillus tianshenii]|uniref:Diguanylate cyclase (GGDEF)-like protein n=1 Tax=Sutcliffiella tianshenii TaxID=1463404 RepID=A0ABS2P1V7_9BACI|nr:diguanylate cyclase [Bacillus tianshenii]MBM7620612.1 diguanylate cyclase (GGDEF)-like protein [Bacillus tianshenii]
MESNNKILEIKSRILDFFLSSSNLTQAKFLTMLQSILKEELKAKSVTVTMEEFSPIYDQLKVRELGAVYQKTLETEGSDFGYINLPLYGDKDFLGAVELQFTSSLPLSLESFDELSKELSTIFQQYSQYIHTRFEEKQYEELYKVTSKFHSSMRVEGILTEIIEILRNTYEDFSYLLLLTSDNDDLQHLPVKKLDFDDSNISAMNAYVTGEVQLENCIRDRRTYIYVPIKGEQGIYGVLQIISLDSFNLPEKELKFITLLANATGTALENAQLYEQSKQVISDLQLINETSHQLNSNLRLQEVTAYMIKKIMHFFEAKEAAFVLYKSGGTEVLPGSTEFFQQEDIGIYLSQMQDYVYSDGEPLFIGDLRVHERLSNLPFCSCMIIPMHASNGIKGACVVTHTLPYFFSFEQFKLLQSLIHHSTLAFSNSMLREELEKYVITDYLTKLYSRKYLDEKIKKSMKHDSYGTFILLDIDDFKRVNDTFGHQIGDTILMQVASIINASIRETDIGARWGGEELAIYLPKIDLALGEHIAGRIIKKIEEQTSPAVTVSCGLSFWKKGLNDSARDLFHRADFALLKAKDLGKNQLCIESEEYCG